MTVVLVHQKGDPLAKDNPLVRPFMSGRAFQSGKFDPGTFGVRGTVRYEVYCPNGAHLLGKPRGCLVLVHANDTRDWADRDLEVSAITEYFQQERARALFGFDRDGLVAVLPFTTEEDDVPIRGSRGSTSGPRCKYGRASLARLLDAVDTRRFDVEAEVLEALRGDGAAERVGAEERNALVILCQGYLAAHGAAADAGGNERKNQLVDRALDRMGWDAVREEARGVSHSEAWVERQRDVRRPDWWRAVFPQRPGDDVLGPVASGDAVNALLDQIYGGAAEVTEGVVAHAYLRLSETA